MGQWVFEELRGAAVRREPKEAELFKTEQTGEGEYAGNDALVREVLQNAIDARSGDALVTVRLAIHEARDAPVTVRLGHFFKRLKEPLASKQIAFTGLGHPTRPCRYFVCEDFGTRGLEGNTKLFSDPPAGDTTPQYFYWFWRNIGRSGKTGDDLGRWGLGKTVYRAASRVGCMFGLTIRESDRKRLLMGQAVLQSHSHNGKEYMPEGYWCGAQDPSGLPLPIGENQAVDGAELDGFQREWMLTRKNEPGLSVVAPYVPLELKADRLLQAVAVHFFSRIVRGELAVEVSGPDLPKVRLDVAGIEAACKQVEWNGPKRTKRHVAPPIAFIKECYRSPPAVTTEILGRERLPELTESSLPAETLAKMRREFGAGELIKLRVLMWLPREKGDGQVGILDVFVRRNTDGLRCDSYYVREGMTITKINSRAGLRGVQALVNVDKGPLAKLLGDTEGPAHEDWDTSQDRPDREWKSWKGRVKFVRGIVDSLTELLTPATTEPDFDLLSDFFSIERVSGKQPQKEPGDKSKDPPKFKPPDVEPTWFRISERAGGFTITRTTNVIMPDKPVLQVSLAYDLPIGNPLKNWSPIDFEIGSGDVRPKGKGFDPDFVKGNVIMLTNVKDNFQFSIDGFDQHRDLLVRVDDLSKNTNGEATA